VARRLILDTAVLITVERTEGTLETVIGADDDVVIAAITVAELYAGIELADERFRNRREQFVIRTLDVIPVEVYDITVARAHGRLLAHVHRAGRPRGAHDLVIAATAVATRRTIVTTDRAARFGDLPGIEAVVLQ
jgi:tRNA(fMet)-specific endonuclease VapC